MAGASGEEPRMAEPAPDPSAVPPPAGPAATPLPSPVLAAETSQAIRIARVLCIVFMMTTHIWPGSDRILAAAQPPAVAAFFSVVVDHLGRSAVPLLSLFSGVLFAFTVMRGKRAAAIVRGKLRALIVPMAFWSVPVLAINLAAVHLLGMDEALPESPLDWVNAFLSLTAPPANGPLHFLREIFVACLCALALHALYRRSAMLGVLAGCALLVAEHAPGDLLFFRPLIPTFFLAGMLLALRGRAGWRPPLWLGLALLALSESVLHLVPRDPLPGWYVDETLLEFLPRLAMSLLMWWFATGLPRWSRRAADAVGWLEPFIFMIFCSHFVTIRVMGAVAAILGLSENDPWYPAFFLLQIPVCIAGGLAAAVVLRKVWPATGGREPPPLVAPRARPQPA